MSNDKSSSSCGCGGFGLVMWIVCICLIVSYCNRQNKNNSFIDNSIETVHQWKNHADSVWRGGEK